jgi:hypothetical protein
MQDPGYSQKRLQTEVEKFKRNMEELIFLREVSKNLKTYRSMIWIRDTTSLALTKK